MLTSISPLGERARHNRWSWTVSWYVASSTLVAGLCGALLGFLGGVGEAPFTRRAAILVVAAVLAVLADLGRLPLPTWHRQVDEDWLNRYRGAVYGAGFGGQLGAGVVTIVTTAAVYLTLVAELVAGSWAAGATIGVVFGIVRAAPILTVARTSSFAELAGRHRRLMMWAAPMRRATVAVMTVGGITAAALAAGAWR